MGTLTLYPLQPVYLFHSTIYKYCYPLYESRIISIIEIHEVFRIKSPFSTAFVNPPILERSSWPLRIHDKSSRSNLHQNLPWNFILLLLCSNCKIIYPQRTAVISWMDFRFAKTPKSSDKNLVYSYEDFYFSKSQTRYLPG